MDEQGGGGLVSQLGLVQSPILADIVCALRGEREGNEKKWKEKNVLGLIKLGIYYAEGLVYHSFRRTRFVFDNYKLRLLLLTTWIKLTL